MFPLLDPDPGNRNKLYQQIKQIVKSNSTQYRAVYTIYYDF